MKPNTFGLLAFSLAGLLAAPAAAQSGTVAEKTSSQRTPDAQEMTDEAQKALLTRGAKATVEDLDRLAQAIRQSLADVRSRERIQMAIAELQEQVRETKLTEPYVRAVVADVYDARFDQLFAENMKKAEAKKLTAEDIDRMGALFKERQVAAQGIELNLRSHQQRLEDAIKALRAKAASATPREVMDLQELVVAARLEVAFNWLAQQAAARGASRADYARARDLLAALASESQVPSTIALAQRLQTALAQLEQRALGGGAVTREEFVAMRDQLISQAREASSGR